MSWHRGYRGKGVCSGEFGKGVPKEESRAHTDRTVLKSGSIWRGKQVTNPKGVCVPNYD